MSIKITPSMIISILIFLLLAFPVLAQDSFGDILGAKNETNKGQEKKAVIGNVQDVRSNKISVQDKKNNTTTDVIIDYKTKVVGQDKKALRLNQIKAKDKVALISTDSATLATDGARLKKALKVFLKPASEATQSKRKAVQGVITDITGGTITLAHQIQRDRIISVTYNSLTTVTMKGIAAPSVADLAVGQRIVVIGDGGQSGSIIAKRIHVIPGLATGIFRKSPVATVTPKLSITPSLSATPSASASGTPSPSATPTAGVDLTPTATPVVTATPTAIPTDLITPTVIP